MHTILKSINPVSSYSSDAIAICCVLKGDSLSIGGNDCTDFIINVNHKQIYFSD